MSTPAFSPSTSRTRSSSPSSWRTVPAPAPLSAPTRSPNRRLTATRCSHYAKSKPGELNYASSGAGTPYHMAAELFKTMSGTNLVHVPHKASGEMRNSVIGGHVQMAFDAITTMAPNVKAGQVRALGTSAVKRSSVLPEVPTIAEAGVPGYESTIWLGIMAPAGTPKAIVDRLNAEINKVITRADVKAAWDQQGAVPLVMTPGEFEAYLRADIEKWAQVVKSAGLRAE